MAKPQTFAEIKAADKSEIKKKHPNAQVACYPLEDEDQQEANFIIIPPSRNVINASGKSALDKDISKVNDIMIKNCVLGGDMKYLDPEYKDQTVFLFVLAEIGKLQKVREGSLKKL